MAGTFWTGKRVVVTGGAGFAGRALVARLLTDGARVVVLDDFSRGQARLWGAEYVQGDAGHYGTCQHAFQGAEAVFNLAAYVAGVLYNQAHQLEMFERNLRLQAVPVQAAAECGVPRFLQVSSVCVYGYGRTAPCREADPLTSEPAAANSGYAWAKRLGERAVRWGNLAHAVTVRPSNLYGPGDYADERAHVIPALARKCLEQDVIRVHGTGYERREFLYVEDAAAGMQFALEHGRAGAVYNLGTERRSYTTIAHLVQALQDVTGTAHKPVEFTGGEAGDRDRWSECAGLRALGWQAQMELGPGLRLAVADLMRNRVAA